jgi:SpoVK/Ycf46/Vps4 family AAA+-type ATPase
MTDGFSGSDLKHLCTTAALIPIRELLAQAGAAALERGAEPLSPDALRPLTHADFDKARAHTKPSVSTQHDVTRELNKWHRMFAEGAGAQTAATDALGF